MPSPEDIKSLHLPHGTTVGAYAHAVRSSKKDYFVRRNSTEIGAPNTRTLGEKLKVLLDIIWYQLDANTRCKCPPDHSRRLLR